MNSIQNVDSEIKKLIGRTKKRVKKTKMQFDIDKNYIKQLWWQFDGKCCLTGIPFADTNERKNARRPYMPSIDRIDSKKGYIKGNVRLVCTAVNMALFTWGLDVFDTIVENRMQIINRPPENFKFYAVETQDTKIINQKIMGRGHTEIHFCLGQGWFKSREDYGLPVPEPIETKHGKKGYARYKYDKEMVAKWLEENPEAYYHPRLKTTYKLWRQES